MIGYADWISLKHNSFHATGLKQARSQGGGQSRGEDPPPPYAQLKQVQLALNRKHAFFDAMS